MDKTKGSGAEVPIHNRASWIRPLYIARHKGTKNHKLLVIKIKFVEEKIKMRNGRTE